MLRTLILSAIVCLGLSACGEPGPQTWNANLDANCKPHDPVDKLYALLSPAKFWREQEYDMGTLKKAGEKNLEISRQVLDDSRAQKGEFFQHANKTARDLGLSGKAMRDHVKKNVDRYNQEVKAIEDRLKVQEKALRWIQKCEQRVIVELRKLNLSPVEFDSEKRPM